MSLVRVQLPEPRISRKSLYLRHLFFLPLRQFVPVQHPQKRYFLHKITHFYTKKPMFSTEKVTKTPLNIHLVRVSLIKKYNKINML